jgi:hypothetical protein
MAKRIKIAWAREPDKKDYPAAERYLCLLFAPNEAAEITARLRKAPVTQQVSRDVMRAAVSSMIGISDSDEERDKILAGQKVSPLLLVSHKATGRVIIADGFHRLCTVFKIDQTSMVPCKIVDSPG